MPIRNKSIKRHLNLISKYVFYIVHHKPLTIWKLCYVRHSGYGLMPSGAVCNPYSLCSFEIKVGYYRQTVWNQSVLFCLAFSYLSVNVDKCNSFIVFKCDLFRSKSFRITAVIAVMGTSSCSIFQDLSQSSCSLWRLCNKCFKSIFVFSSDDVWYFQSAQLTASLQNC